MNTKILSIVLIVEVTVWAALSIWRESSVTRMYTALMMRQAARFASQGTATFKEPEWVSKYFEQVEGDNFSYEAMKLDPGMKLARFPAAWFHTLFAVAALLLNLLAV